MNFSYRNFLIMLISIFSSLWIAGCVDLPTDIKPPQWDVDLNVPLVNRSYTLSDIIREQKNISVKGTSSTDSIYVLQSDTYSQITRIANFIELNTQAASIGNIIPVGISGSAAVYLPIPEGAELDAGIFIGGSLSFHIANPNQEDVNLNIAFPGIIKDGMELNIPMIAPALQQDSVQISLAGCIYNLPANQQTQHKTDIQIIVSNLSSSLPLISVATIDFYCSDFAFSSATGYLPTKSLGIMSKTYSLNLGSAFDFRNNTTLKYGTIELDARYFSPVTNTFNFQLKNLNLIGIRDDGSQMALTDSTGNSNLTFTITNDALRYTYTEANSNVTSLLSFLPSQVILNVEYIMNPDNKTATATDQDSIVLSTNFSTQSVLAFQKSIITDTTDLNISDQDALKIKDAKSAYINVNVQNGIPLDSWVTVTFLDGQYKPLFTLTNSGNSDSIFVASANVNSSGEVTSPVTSNNLIELDSTQTSKLAIAHYVISSVGVRTNGALNGSVQYVAVRPNDLLQINVYGGVKYHVNTNDLK